MAAAVVLLCLLSVHTVRVAAVLRQTVTYEVQDGKVTRWVDSFSDSSRPLLSSVS